MTNIEDPPPSIGTIDWTSDGDFTFYPKPKWFGEVELQYSVLDPTDNRTTYAFLTIAIPGPDAPIARPDLYYCIQAQPCAPDVSVLVNDESKTGGALSVAGIESPPVPGGAVTIKSSGMFTYYPSPL